MNTDPTFNLAENAMRVGSVRKDVEVEAFLQRLNECVSEIEPEYPDSAPAFPVVLVVGAPRSGHTIMSQVIGRCFDVGIVNHVVARFWSAPVTGIRISLATLGRTPALGLKSKHGLTCDPRDPHEFGYFWYQRLRYQAMRIGASQANASDLEGLRNCLAAMTAAYGRPLLCKNLMAGLMAGELARHVPLRIVRMKRDMVDAALSTLRCRGERYGDEKTWWSVKTADVDALRSQSPDEQVLQQQLQVNRALDEQLARPGVAALDVEYDSLAECTGETVARIQEFLSPEIALRKEADIPSLSPVSHSGNPVHERLKKLMRQMGGGSH